MGIWRTIARIKDNMSGRKTRASANAPENATLSVNERILKDCHSLYVDEQRGEQTGSHFGFEGVDLINV